MLKVDYLIVGQGIAGSVLALTLEQMGKSVAIIGKPELSSSSRIAAGVYNPFNFRKSIPVWKAEAAVPVAKAFYTSAEKITGAQFHRETVITRVFSSHEERLDWECYMQDHRAPFVRAFSDQEEIGPLLSPEGYGILGGGGIVNTAALLSSVREHFNKRGYYFEEPCEHNLFSANENVIYDSRIEASHAIFCEGHLAKNNPYFDSKVVAPTKGELIHVSIPGFDQTDVINGEVYLPPLGKDRYVCGATFKPGKADEEITDAGKEELVRKLKALTHLPFEVLDHHAGVRPAGRDRKPVIGRSRNYQNFSIFNGFGSKAVLYSPFLAQMLANHLENEDEILPEVDVARFKVY